ncbi:MAG: ATP-binding protein [Candidatus Nanopelagicales bacterium]
MLKGTPDQVRRARGLVHGFVVEGRLPTDADVAVLLTSEIVTNALRHGRAPFRLTVEAVDGTLRVEVRDAGGNGRPTVRGATPEDLGGRGLALVDTLADAWGWQPDGTRGTVVWFELTA